jgi:regulatory protein
VKPAGPRSLKGRALQWLAQREHSRLELRRKLLPHAEAEDAAWAARAAPDLCSAEAPGDSAEVPPASARVDALLDWLEAHRYLSEQRFAESRIHARSARFGNRRIRQELSQHGIGLNDDVSEALQGSELERARSVWGRKFERAVAIAQADAAARAKQARFLTARGFSPEVVRQVLREVAARTPSTMAGEDDFSI